MTAPRTAGRRWRWPLPAPALLLACAAAASSGCATRPFVYRPNGPAGVPPVPVRVAVLPFENGTEDFVEVIRHERKLWNLSRASYFEVIEALPPERWARDLAADLAASGRFASVRFVYSLAELAGEEVVVEGTLVRAYLMGVGGGEFELALRARATRDGKALWAALLVRTHPRWDASQLHRWAQGDMAEMFAEAGEGLAQALAARPVAGSAAPGPKPSAGRPAEGEPVDETIRRILEGK